MSIEFIPEHFKIKEMWEKAAEVELWTLESIFDQYKTQKVHNKSWRR